MHRFPYAVSLPQGVMPILLFPQQQKTSNTCVRDGSAQRSQLETHRPISLLGLSHQAPSAEYLPKFQIPRRKADV